MFSQLFEASLFALLPKDIAAHLSSHGGEFGERVGLGKDAQHLLRWRERSSRP
jgi:hypothetical protein